MNPSVQTLCEHCTIQQAGSAEGCPWGWPVGPAHCTVAPVAHSLDSSGISKSVRSDLIKKTPSGSRAVQIQVRPHKSLKLDCLGRQQCHNQMEVLLNLWKPYRDIFKKPIWSIERSVLVVTCCNRHGCVGIWWALVSSLSCVRVCNSTGYCLVVFFFLTDIKQVT